MRSTNPVLRGVARQTYVSDRPVTYANVATKSVFLIGLVFISAMLVLFTFSKYITMGVLIGAVVLGFVSVIVGTISVKLSPYFAIIYAISEGVLLAVISALYASLYEGIVPTALITTFIVFIIMLLLYTTRVIKVNQRFASILVVSLISVIVMGLLSFVLPFSSNLYYVVVILASVLSAFFLLLDFKLIETCVESGVDSRYGWVLSLGLLVTLVWIYIQMLRLLSLLSRRR